MIRVSSPTDSKCMTPPSAPSLEIIVINVKQAEERRRFISTQFTTLGHSWRFFEAHTKLTNPALRYDPSQIIRTYGREMTPSQLALYSSHYSAIAEFAEKGERDFLLVFEDDVLFDTAFPLDALTRYCSDTGIDYIRLFGMYYAAAKQLNFFFDRAIVRYRTSPAGAQAYMLSRKGAKRVVETCRGIDTAWDLSLDEFWKTGLAVYSVFPFPVMERFSPTSVPMNEFAQLPPRKQLAWVAHRARNKLRKLQSNIWLTQTDRSLRARDPGFQQIDKSTVRHD